MMGHKQTKYPCIGSFKTRNEDGHRRELEPNEYDMLWLQNMKQILGNKLWMWPFPFAQEMKGNGMFFPRIPDVPESDAITLLKNRTGASAGPPESDFLTDPQSYIDKAVDKYAGNTFVLNDKDPQTQQEVVKTFKIERSEALAENLQGEPIEPEY